MDLASILGSLMSGRSSSLPLMQSQAIAMPQGGGGGIDPFASSSAATWGQQRLGSMGGMGGTGNIPGGMGNLGGGIPGLSNASSGGGLEMLRSPFMQQLLRMMMMSQGRGGSGNFGRSPLANPMGQGNFGAMSGRGMF